MVKQEAESCSSAVNHRIPEGFSQPGSCYRVCVSLTFIVRLTSHFGLLGEQVEILKNLMSQSSVTWASAVILLSVNLKWEAGGRAWALFSSGTNWFFWLSQLPLMATVQRVSLLACAASSCVWSCMRSYMTKFVFVARPLMSACLHTLSSAWMCTRECVFEGQRSQSCPMTTEGLKNPWPQHWSCRATIYRAKTSHCSQMLKGVKEGFNYSQKNEKEINL